jgi:hypothetical protein
LPAPRRVDVDLESQAGKAVDGEGAAAIAGEAEEREDSVLRARGGAGCG